MNEERVRKAVENLCGLIDDAEVALCAHLDKTVERYVIASWFSEMRPRINALYNVVSEKPGPSPRPMPQSEPKWPPDGDPEGIWIVNDDNWMDAVMRLLSDLNAAKQRARAAEEKAVSANLIALGFEDTLKTIQKLVGAPECGVVERVRDLVTAYDDALMAMSKYGPPPPHGFVTLADKIRLMRINLSAAEVVEVGWRARFEEVSKERDALKRELAEAKSNPLEAVTMAATNNDLLNALPFGTVVRRISENEWFVMAPGHSAGTVDRTLSRAVSGEFSCYHGTGNPEWEHAVETAREVWKGEH